MYTYKRECKPDDIDGYVPSRATLLRTRLFERILLFIFINCAEYIF